MVKTETKNNVIEKMREALIEQGFQSSKKTGNFANINVEGGFIKGVYQEKVVIEKDKEEYIYHRFVQADGYGKDFSGNPVEIKGEVLISSTGLMDYLLKGKEGKEVALIYLGTKKVEGYKKPLHQYELFTK